MATLKLPLDPLVLSIGIGRENGPDPESGETALFLGYNLVDAEQIRRVEPDKVLSWLFCSAYDAYDVAHALVEAGFRGSYRAVAERLPDSESVAREIRGCFPGLDFGLICPAPVSEKAALYHHKIADVVLAVV